MRLDILKNDILQKLVYYNAAGFLMIKEENLSIQQQNQGTDILDRTRIHPELYTVAKRMAKSALDNDDSPDVIEKAMQQPEKL
jgi:transcription elongation factor SPT6